VPAWWYTLGTYLQILIARGDLRRAAEIAGGTEWGDQLPDAVILPIPRVVRGELHAAMGRAGAAADDLIAAGEWLEERGFANPSWCPWRMIAAPQITATRPGQAREIAAEAVHRARRFGAPWALGKALRAAGLVAGGDAGTQLLAESVSVLDGSGAHFEHACSLVEHGAALRRRGYRTDARPPLRAGLDLAVRCGALPLAARARDELAAAGARPRSARLTGPEALTASELRVARLAADGLRKAEIAQTLFVTRKTVEKHLAGAYAKLGIGSRAEIAEALAPGPGRGSRPLP
jgi:DNA-binding CsgD family transcriptional regulator